MPEINAPPIKVGFVGLSSRGWAATALAPALIQPSLKEKFTLTAVSTTSEASASESAKKYTSLTGSTVKGFYGSTASIAADENVDFVAVSVKASRHKEAILPIIASGKPFFIEWPVGRNMDETVEIATAARHFGAKSMIGLQGRNSPTVKKVKELIASGAIGAVRSILTINFMPREMGAFGHSVRADNKYVVDEANGVTALRILMGHALDTVIQTFGELVTINATATQAYPIATIIDADGNPTGETIPNTAPDHYNISGRLESGALLTMIMRVGDKSAPGRRNFLWEIDGDEGSIRLESEGLGMGTMNPDFYLNGEKVEVEGSEKHLIGILGAAWEAFYDGKEDQYATIDDAVRNHERLEAISKSLAEGRTVALSEVLP